MNTLQLQKIQQIYQFSVEISYYRSQLHISDSSFLFALKNLTKKRRVKPSLQLNSLTDKELSDLINELSQYLNKLKKAYNIFKPLIQTVNFSRSIFRLLFAKPKKIKLNSTNKNLLVVFGAIPFQFRYQRPQHLIKEIKDHFNGSVIYIDPTFIEHHIPSQPLIAWEEYQGISLINTSATRNLHLQLEQPSKTDELIIINSIKKTLGLIDHSKIIIKIDHPFWSFITDYIKAPVIYDCMDEHDAFEVGSQHLAALERKIVESANVVFAASHKLYDRLSKYKPKRLVLLKNGCDYNHFAHPHSLQTPDDMQGAKGKIIGYYGAIAEWFDEKLLCQALASYPQHTFVLIGEVTHPTIRQVTLKYNNVLFLGEKPYSQLPTYLKYFDVCLIPFVINELIKATNPVKIYEYFAAGKAVVSTALPELEDYKESLYISKNITDFVKNIELALIEKNENHAEKRKNIARNNTWGKRGDVLKKEIDLLLAC